MTIFIDANVLYRISDVDLLFTLAEAGLVDIRYSAYVEGEAIRNLLANRGDHDAVRRRFRSMREAFADSYLPHVDRGKIAYGLRDQDDEQVVFDAVRAAATHLATYNLRDFRSPGIPTGLEVRAPTELVNELAESWPPTDLGIVMEEWRVAKNRPSRTQQELLNDLTAWGYDRFARVLAREWGG